MPTPTVSKRLLLSALFAATGTALVGGACTAPRAPSAEPKDIGTQVRATETIAVAPAAPKARPLARTGPVKVLVLGDSHTSTTFGRALDLLFRSRPNTEVTTVGACGHRPGGFLDAKESRCGVLELHGNETRWAKEASPPSVDDLLSHENPDLVVVELGANQIHTAWKDPKGARAEISALATKLAARGQCVWVGPPTGREKEKPRKKIDHVYALLAQALPAGCTLLDSRPEALDFLVWNDLASKAKRRGDGRHFDSLGPIGQQAARRWALHVFQSVTPALDAVGRGERLVSKTMARTPNATRLALAD